MRKIYCFGLLTLLSMTLCGIAAVAQGQWKFSGDKHKSLQVYIERIFHQRYPLVML